MSKQVIAVGQNANDKSGDKLRTAFIKTNANFDETYSIATAAQVTASQALIAANDAQETADAAEPSANKSNDPDMAADSATLFPTQQAVRAYVAANGGGGGSFPPEPIVLTADDEIVIDMAVWNMYIITLSENTVFSTINHDAGKRATVIIRSNGAFNLSYDVPWQFVIGAAPTVSESGQTFKFELTGYGAAANQILAEFGSYTEPN